MMENELTKEHEELTGEQGNAAAEPEEEISGEKRRSPLKAIRLKCLDCSGGSSKEVSLCETSGCALHAFRFGRNPWRPRREYSEEEKERLLAQLRRGKDENQETPSSGE